MVNVNHGVAACVNLAKVLSPGSLKMVSLHYILHPSLFLWAKMLYWSPFLPLFVAVDACDSVLDSEAFLFSVSWLLAIKNKTGGGWSADGEGAAMLNCPSLSFPLGKWNLDPCHFQSITVRESLENCFATVIASTQIYAKCKIREDSCLLFFSFLSSCLIKGKCVCNSLPSNSNVTQIMQQIITVTFSSPQI